MCQTNEHEPIVVKAEDCVVGKVDPVDVSSDDVWRKRRAEAQVPVPHGQREKMRHERSTYALIQAFNSEKHLGHARRAASCAIGAPRLWNKPVTPARIPIAIKADKVAAIATATP